MKKCKIKYEDVGINEILNIVHDLNIQMAHCASLDKHIEDFLQEYCHNAVNFSCDGHCGINCLNSASITFLGFEIWSTEDNHREFDEDKNEYEPLEKYLKTRIKKIINGIGKIRI